MKITTLRFLILISFLLLFGSKANAQPGGQSVYSFLNTVPSARIAAVGGHQPALQEEDLTLSYGNPALIDSTLDQYASLGYVRYIADINMGYASHARYLEEYGGTFQASLHFMDYGTFQRADEFGNRAGEFSAGDYALSLGHARGWGDFRAGANVKMIYSAMESYNSFGMALDAGGFYYHEDNEWGVAAVVRNLGMQLFSHSGNGREPLPLDIQVGTTKKLVNAPVRFTVVAHSLQNPDLTFRTGQLVRNLETGELEEEEPPVADKVFRHFTAATELVFSENLQFRFGYNHQRRRELSLENLPGFSGFSWGFGIGIRRFRIDFARATYNQAATSSHITISSNMNEWFK